MLQYRIDYHDASSFGGLQLLGVDCVVFTRFVMGGLSE